MPLTPAAKLQVTLFGTALLVGGGALALASYSPIERLLEGDRRTIAPEVREQFTNPKPAEVKKKAGCGAAGGKCCCAAVNKVCGCSGKPAAAAERPELADNVAVMTAAAVGLSAPGSQGLLGGPAVIVAAPKLRPVGD